MSEPVLLDRELERRAGRLRPAELVMQPETMGAARLNRYSFSRTMLRRAVADGWSAWQQRLDLDDEGRGEAEYVVEAGGRRFTFVAFTTTLDEATHTDRVVADAWEISAALVEGEPDEELLDVLRVEVPLQERSRLDPRVLVLTRGNRSVRFFDYLVACLAAGKQPCVDVVADAGYIMRSTAFYGNGKFGMRSFEGYDEGHPLRVPYRAQMVAAWLFRELSYDVVEHCARAASGDDAACFDPAWRTYFGLGNATGLGLVPYAFKHPQVLHAWVAVREIALADVRAIEHDGDRLARLDTCLERARRHFRSGTDDDCGPFLNAVELVAVVDAIGAALSRLRGDAFPFDRLYRWAEDGDPETAELVVSLLVELHDGDDDLFDSLLTVDDHPSRPGPATAAEVVELIDRRYGWLRDLGLDGEGADRFWWVVSDNNEEPRRVDRRRLEPDGRDVAVDVALRMWRLRGAARLAPPATPAAELVANEPELRLALERLTLADRAYCEPRDNCCGAGYLPLMLQRFQLAMYGMDNFKPKSTDWLRVTLFQGAPRMADLGEMVDDDWVLPLRPEERP